MSYLNGVTYCSRSQWPRDLRRGSTAARLLGLWFRVPPRSWLSIVSVVCCQVEVSATNWSLVQRSPTECGVSKKCVIVKPRKTRRPRPPRGCRAIEKKYCSGVLFRMNRVVRCTQDRQCTIEVTFYGMIAKYTHNEYGNMLFVLSVCNI
jgi:hypothetical protein